MARPRVTARCEEDLDALPPDEAGALLDKFIEQRAHVPEAGDLINNWLFRRFEEYSPLPAAPRLLVDR